MEKNKGGRPVSVWTAKRLKEVEEKIIEYTDQTDIPILAEFAYKNNILREQLYQYPQLSYAIKRLMAKKETALERKGLEGNNTMAIFSLKQLGWRDNIEMTGKDGKDLISSVNINIVRNKKDESGS